VSEAEQSAPAAAGAKRPPWARYALIGLGVAVVGLTFFYFLPQIADYRDVWDVVKTLSAPWIAALGAAVVLNLATFPPPWMVALPGLSFRHALVMTQASTALSIVTPAGAAVGMAGSYGMLRAWRFPGGAVARAVTLTGVWNQFASLTFPVCALFFLAIDGQTNPALTTAAFVGVAILGASVGGLVLVLYSQELARDVGNAVANATNWCLRRIRRGPVGWNGDAFARFRNEAVSLLRRRWPWLTLATLAGHLTVFVVLLVSLRALGVSAAEVSVAEAFAAWALARILGTIPITPAGLGVVELSLTGSLIAFGGANADVVAAVLVYRFLTIVPTLVLGGVAALTWKAHRPEPN
jgi:uncharacterized membrane protein YbhN (UPF0104 family)